MSGRQGSRQGSKDEARAATGFGVTVLAAIGLAVVYARGGQPQLEGVLLATALAGLAYGFVTWGHRLLPQGPVEQARHELASTAAERRGVEADFERGGVVERRTLLKRMLGLAAAALGAAAVFPIRSLGPSPGKSLERTPWKAGSRLVTEDGTPLSADSIPVGGFFTVFPEGAVGSADGQTVLIRVEDRSVGEQGLLAFNKVCTHAGCPVGLYQTYSQRLFCPCHQSTFDVVDGAKPSFGPSKRPLPQLPLGVEGEFLVARGDFSHSVGPGYWNYG